jgi:serine/threonine protein kinase
MILPGLKRYKILSLIGDGTYGLVYLATNIETRERVAIKAMKRKYHSWDEVIRPTFLMPLLNDFFATGLVS